MAEAVLTLNGRGDLLVALTPEQVASLGFPHSLTWTVREDGAILGKPSLSKWSNRQIKKFKQRHGLP